MIKHLNIFFLVLQDEPYHKFKIPIATEEFSSEIEEQGLSCDLIFTYTAKYPDESPLIEVDESTNFRNGFEEKLVDHIRETVNIVKINLIQNNCNCSFVYITQIEENLGMEMIFSLVSTAQEWLNLRWDEIKQEDENEKLAILRAHEEAERVIIHRLQFCTLI